VSRADLDMPTAITAETSGRDPDKDRIYYPKGSRITFEFPAKGLEKKIERVRGGHQKDWLNAVREGRQAGSNFDYGGALTEIGLLGVIAIHHPGQRLEWDAEAMKFINNASANAMISPTVRSGWQI
jgi:hypothetical protein